MPTHATALFADRHAAHAAVEQLVQAGFPRDAISVVVSEGTQEREFGAASSEQSGVRFMRLTGVLGAIVSNLVGLSAPDGLALRAAGPLLGAFRRASEAADASAFNAAFETDGLTTEEARFLDQGIRTGSIVVGVQATDDRVRLATQLLELAGGAHRGSSTSAASVHAATVKTVAS